MIHLLSKAFAIVSMLALAIAPSLGTPAVAKASGLTVAQATTLKVGSPIAKLFVPRFGKSWARVVYEGTSVSKVLTPLGIGHFSKSGLPGQPGNFALAAHRFASGGAFLNIDKLKKGDRAIVETSKKRFTYRLIASKVVEPTDTWVINSKPEGLTVPVTSKSLMTFITCTPVHVNTHRYVAWFELVSEEKL